MTAPTDLAVRRVTLYFDPACPWTWQTSRWLVDTATAKAVPVEYAALELSDGQPIADVPAEHRDAARASRRFLRGVTAARARGQHDLVGRWYTAFGTERWDAGTEVSVELVTSTLAAAGGSELLDALDDPALDEPMARSRQEALEWAGDDVGSPVTVWDLGDLRRGFFGPVVSRRPATGSDLLWDAVVRAATVGEFFELKSRRTEDPTSRR